MSSSSHRVGRQTDVLLDDEATLAACALVCRSFLTPARQKLYHTLSFTVTYDYVAGSWRVLHPADVPIVATLQAPPYLRPFVRDLQVDDSATELYEDDPDGMDLWHDYLGVGAYGIASWDELEQAGLQDELLEGLEEQSQENSWRAVEGIAITLIELRAVTLDIGIEKDRRTE
ncbi:hypothetical protein JCM11641_001700 [Rhodosporidiobolus odoratus]